MLLGPHGLLAGFHCLLAGPQLELSRLEVALLLADVALQGPEQPLPPAQVLRPRRERVLGHLDRAERDEELLGDSVGGAESRRGGGQGPGQADNHRASGTTLSAFQPPDVVGLRAQPRCPGERQP